MNKSFVLPNLISFLVFVMPGMVLCNVYGRAPMFPPQQALQPNFRYEPGPVAAKKIEPTPLDKFLKETMDAFTNIKYDVSQLSNHANSALSTFRTAETLLGNPTRRSFFEPRNLDDIQSFFGLLAKSIRSLYTLITVLIKDVGNALMYTVEQPAMALRTVIHEIIAALSLDVSSPLTEIFK